MTTSSQQPPPTLPTLPTQAFRLDVPLPTSAESPNPPDSGAGRT